MSKCRKGKQHHEEGILLIQSIHEEAGGQGMTYLCRKSPVPNLRSRMVCKAGNLYMLLAGEWRKCKNFNAVENKNGTA